MEIVINAEGCIFGRLCSYAAKKALEGNEIVVVNSEQAIISGNKTDVIKRYNKLIRKGGFSQKGPKYSKVPYMMLKRGIRGMLPDHRKGIGKQAFSRIKCYNSVPQEFSEKKMIKIKCNRPIKFISLKELSKKI